MRKRLVRGGGGATVGAGSRLDKCLATHSVPPFGLGVRERRFASASLPQKFAETSRREAAADR
jgi:hypothetical protein